MVTSKTRKTVPLFATLAAASIVALFFSGLVASSERANAFSSQVVPLFRYWNQGNTDHYYTTNFAELRLVSYGYKLESVMGGLWSTQESGTVPLFEYWNAAKSDHFYTTSISEGNNAVANYGYQYIGIVGYIATVYPGPDGAIHSVVPMYRYWNPTTFDHFYTTSISEGNNAVANYGYQYEGFVGYLAA